MPLQHISDDLLKVMRRRVTRKQTETLLEKLRKWIPGIAIRTTFIAGSPGETEDQFQELLQFVKGFGFEMMGVFAYSPEPGTAMGRLEGQIPDKVKKEAESSSSCSPSRRSPSRRPRPWKAPIRRLGRSSGRLRR